MSAAPTDSEPEILNVVREPLDAPQKCDLYCGATIAEGWFYDSGDREADNQETHGVVCDDCIIFHCDFCDKTYRTISRTCSTCSAEFCDNCRISDATECPECIDFKRPRRGRMTMRAAFRVFDEVSASLKDLCLNGLPGPSVAGGMEAWVKSEDGIKVLQADVQTLESALQRMRDVVKFAQTEAAKAKRERQS